ncbi:hypothetical protein Taro_008673 [Colocasia esculenta]|uniref:Uncharacterized protein n=1 Tax=Colocasia esculenta TaxID=4460 RepID=A0A843U3P3_COLES|nr:hypothetical protein [Colocasia esculenta]
MSACLPYLVEVWNGGACVVRLWSHVVAPMFRELLVSTVVCRGWLAFQQGPSVSCRRVLLLLLGARAMSVVAVSLVLRLDSSSACTSVWLFEFIAYLTGLNSNPSGSSNPWEAARPSGSLAGVREVGSLQNV